MNNKSHTLVPNMGLVFIIVLGIMSSAILMFLGYEGSGRRAPHPMITFVAGLIILFNESKIITLSRDMLRVKYLFFLKRRISWDRIQDVRLVNQRNSFYLLIALDGVKLFTEPSRNVDNYIVLHPIRVVAFRIIDEDKKDIYLKLFKSFYSEVHLLYEGHSTGDGLREP